jgi:hypothetical protein
MSHNNYQDIDIEWLSALDPADVDFLRLPEKALEQLAFGTEPNFATLALVELRERNKLLAAETARRLLSAEAADRYLKATALSVLFDSDRAAALSYMFANAHHADALLVNTIMQIMIREPEAFQAGGGERLVPLMKSRLNANLDEEYFGRDARELFEEIYGRNV